MVDGLAETTGLGLTVGVGTSEAEALGPALSLAGACPVGTTSGGRVGPTGWGSAPATSGTMGKVSAIDLGAGSRANWDR